MAAKSNKSQTLADVIKIAFKSLTLQIGWDFSPSWSFTLILLLNTIGVNDSSQFKCCWKVEQGVEVVDGISRRRIKSSTWPPWYWVVERKKKREREKNKGKEEKRKKKKKIKRRQGVGWWVEERRIRKEFEAWVAMGKNERKWILFPLLLILGD